MMYTNTLSHYEAWQRFMERTRPLAWRKKLERKRAA